MSLVQLRISIISAVAVLLNMVVMAAPVKAQTLPVTEADYWKQIRHTLDVVTSLDSSDTNAVHAALDAEAQAITSMTSIVLNDGTIVSQDNSYLVGLLQQDPPDLQQIESYLRLLSELPAESEESSSQVLSHAGPTPSEILARPEFQWEEEKPNTLQAWLDKMYSRLLDFLVDLFPGVQTPSLLRPFITIVGVVLVALILGYALRGLLFDVVSNTELHAEEDESGLPLTAAGALQKAQDNAATGDYRTAVRFLYLSTLLQLEEHDLLRYDRARTNREYLRSVAHLPELATLLRDVVDVFDRVWYGYQTIDEDSFQRYVARVTELRHFR